MESLIATLFSSNVLDLQCIQFALVSTSQAYYHARFDSQHSGRSCSSGGSGSEALENKREREFSSSDNHQRSPFVTTAFDLVNTKHLNVPDILMHRLGQ